MSPTPSPSPLLRLYTTQEAGKRGYPLNWAAISLAVRELSGHRCARCMHPFQFGCQGAEGWSPCDAHCDHGGPIRLRLDLSGIEAQWRILTIHHQDGNKLNCRWGNLVALCQRDHLRIQASTPITGRDVD